MKNVAELAGVSLSTVSRVINDRPRVAPATAELVRRAMAQVQFTPQIRRVSSRSRSGGGALQTVAFLVLGTSDEPMTPGFEKLLRGVSDGAAEQQINLLVHFVSDVEHLPATVTQHRIDGLLLHGTQPTGLLRERLQELPTVWLMANRQRPAFGDQVMPDNESIGEIAAHYLLERGQRILAFLEPNMTWAMDIRSQAFCRAAREQKAHIEILSGPAVGSAAGSSGECLRGLIRELVEQMLASRPQPTGLFVAEDRLMPAVEAALQQHGVRLGQDLTVISCNYEPAHLMGLSVPPATIDIRVESIGRRGLEQLRWRMQHPEVVERFRALVEPILVIPGAPAARGQEVITPAVASV